MAALVGVGSSLVIAGPSNHEGVLRYMIELTVYKIVPIPIPIYVELAPRMFGILLRFGFNKIQDGRRSSHRKKS